MTSLPSPPRLPAPPASANAAFDDAYQQANVETTAVPTLKVMRLPKPSLHTPTAGSISSTGSPLLTTAMCLPDSFGTISVGETFSAYLGALNTSTTKSVQSLKVIAQLQTPTQRYQLAASRFDDANAVGGVQVLPLQVVDSIVSHGPLLEQGQHILRVEVSYLQVMGDTTQTPKSIRKFYRFQVTQPLTVQHHVWRQNDQCVFVSVEIKNNFQSVDDTEGMTISSVTFETFPGLVADDVGSTSNSNNAKVKTRSTSTISTTPSTNTPSVASVSALKLFDNCGRLNAGSSRRYLFRVRARQSTGQTDDESIRDVADDRLQSDVVTTANRGIAAGDEIGKPIFVWRKACGEMGRFEGPRVLCPDLPLRSLFGSRSAPATATRPESVMEGHDDSGRHDFVVYTHSQNNGGGGGGSGGSALSIDVATKTAARVAAQQQGRPSYDSQQQQQQQVALDEWMPVTVEPINPPTTIVVGVPTPVSFMVVNHSEQALSLQLQFLLDHMKGIAVCGPSFVNLQENLPSNGGTTIVEIRLICFQPGLAKVSGCSVIDLATGAPIPQLPQFHALAVPAAT